MNPNSEYIQQVVTLVLQRLDSLRELNSTDGSVSSNSRPRTKPHVVYAASSKTLNDANAFRLDEKVVSLDSLRQLPNHFQSSPVRKNWPNPSQSRTVILRESAIVTPSAKEWLADRAIRLETRKASQPDESNKSKAGTPDILHKRLTLLCEQGSWLDKKSWMTSQSIREPFHETFDLSFDQIVSRCNQKADQGNVDFPAPVIVVATTPHLMCSKLNRDDTLRAAAINDATCLTRLQIEMQPNVIVIDGKASNVDLLVSVVNSIRSTMGHFLKPHSVRQGAPK